MKSRCEKCRCMLRARGEAYICSFECTFCPTCASEMHHVCPNCQGELIRRPRRPALVPPEKIDESLQIPGSGVEQNHRVSHTTSAAALPSSDGHTAHHAFILRGKLTAKPEIDRVVVRTGGRVVFLDIDEIDWIEAAANYVRVHSGKDCYLVRESIGGISEQLAPGRFVRIHRSIVANICKIKELQPCNTGEYILVLKDGKELPCSRGYRRELRHLIRPD
ncbi:MAG TPA: DUF1272 domain-containing protein [Candidatus Angelobacter sp.]